MLREESPLADDVLRVRDTELFITYCKQSVAEGNGQASRRQSFNGRPLTQSIVTYFKDNSLSFKAMPEFGRLIRPWGPKGELVERHEFCVIRRLHCLSFSPQVGLRLFAA
jgi:hypothetical protein